MSQVLAQLLPHAPVSNQSTTQEGITSATAVPNPPGMNRDAISLLDEEQEPEYPVENESVVDQEDQRESEQRA